MEAQTVDIKQLRKNLSKISEQAEKGQLFIIVERSKPIFRIEPMEFFKKPQIRPPKKRKTFREGM
ncbi:MAG: hypothetical protein V1690_02450 [Candidatus Moraniibacteriota bacterium]